MEQCKKIMLEAPEGMLYQIKHRRNGEMIIRLISDCSVTDNGVENEEVYFSKISTQDREIVRVWLEKQKYETEKEKRFLERVAEAINVIDYDYWIANIEPSVKNEEIYYLKGKTVGVGFSCEHYEMMAEDFAPERGARLAKEHELFLWYGLRAANSLWTLDYVANDSSSFGNYYNSPKSAREIENTGKRLCGGYYDGQGNTYKIVTTKKGFALVGGCYGHRGDIFPVADVTYCIKVNKLQIAASGVVVLTQ